MKEPGLDHRLLEALFFIEQTRSFEKAARKLSITQSAVSQRIRQLEISLECRLIIRSSPLTLTQTGESLAAHFRRVRFLESQWKAEKLPARRSPGKISIAANRDSLSTWLPEALADVTEQTGVMLEIWSEDQSRTLELLSSGKVEACISSDSTAPNGYETIPLGVMDYHCVATKAFIEKYFSNGIHPESLNKAPVVIFDKNDHLHGIFLEQHMGFKGIGLTCPYHELPDHHGFLHMIVRGLCYGLVPRQETELHLKEGTLRDVFPGHTYPLPLFLHSWAYGRAELKKIVDIISKRARSFFSTPFPFNS